MRWKKMSEVTEGQEVHGVYNRGLQPIMHGGPDILLG